MTDVRLLIKWFIKGGNLNTHLGGLRHLGNPVIACIFWKSRGYRVIILWNATQAQRDHKIIHARNFRVQPQAIIVSSIVE